MKNENCISDFITKATSSKNVANQYNNPKPGLYAVQQE